VQDARADDPGDHHREPEVDDDLAVEAERPTKRAPIQVASAKPIASIAKYAGTSTPKRLRRTGRTATPYGDCFAGFFPGLGPTMYSRSISPMPTVMAMSATLKVGQCARARQWAWMKSTT
jgi:hypothetical protein